VCLKATVQAWTYSFFKLLASLYKQFMYVKVVTEKKERLDVSRFVIRTNSLDLINYSVRVRINEDLFVIISKLFIM